MFYPLACMLFSESDPRPSCLPLLIYILFYASNSRPSRSPASSTSCFTSRIRGRHVIPPRLHAVLRVRSAAVMFAPAPHLHSALRIEFVSVTLPHLVYVFYEPESRPSCPTPSPAGCFKSRIRGRRVRPSSSSTFCFTHRIRVRHALPPRLHCVLRAGFTAVMFHSLACMLF